PTDRTLFPCILTLIGRTHLRIGQFPHISADTHHFPVFLGIWTVDSHSVYSLMKGLTSEGASSVKNRYPSSNSAARSVSRIAFSVLSMESVRFSIFPLRTPRNTLSSPFFFVLKRITMLDRRLCLALSKSAIFFNSDTVFFKACFRILM